MIDFKLIMHYLPILLKGTAVSLKIAFFACSIGLILGTLLGLIQTSKYTFLKIFAKIYITILRGTPMLVQIAFIYFVLPNLGINISAFCTAVIAIGLNSSAYVSEIIRSGIMSINKGQIEAAKCLGFSQIQTVRYIILPQALAVITPTLGNEFITLIKDSSLASTIGVMELFKEGRNIINQTYDALSIYFAISLIYIFLTTTLTILVYKFEKRVNKHVKN